MNQTIFDALRASAAALAHELDRLPAEAALWPPAEGEWSQQQCLTHLHICEHHIFLPRIQAIATQDNPMLALVDEPALMQQEFDPQRPRAELLAEFLAYREEELALLSNADWARPGVHAARGPITLAWMADYTWAHTLEHLSQMARVRLSYATRRV
jgi:hypothetical protein